MTNRKIDDELLTADLTFPQVVAQRKAQRRRVLTKQLKDAMTELAGKDASELPIWVAQWATKAVI
jgi:hypothetical protein